MARKRMIDPKFWQDDKMMSLTPMHRLLFIGIWNFSDDGGIHKNSDNMLKAEVFPGDDITVEEVGRLKDELIQQELIVPFNSEGIELFYVKNWKIYQSIQKPIPSKYTLPEDYCSPTVVLQPNRIERNKKEKNIIKKSVEDENAHTTVDLIAFADKYKTIDIPLSYKKFNLNQLSKNRKSVNEAADFEMWVLHGIENGWNLRAPESNMGIETGDTLATVYCPYCDAKREVNRGKEAREAFCQCGNTMFYKNEYLHEKGRIRTISKKKLPEIEQVPF
jgi:hypothetical protein